MGVSGEDWMWRLAKETREIDAQLRAYREERLPLLQGKDLDVWAWKGWNNDQEEAQEGVLQDGTTSPAVLDSKADGEKDAFGSIVKTDVAQVDDASPAATPAGLVPPAMDRRRSALSQEITFADSSSPADEPDADVVAGTAPSSPLTQPSGPSGAPERTQEAGAQAGQKRPAPEVAKTPGGRIVVEDASAKRARLNRYGQGTGSWTAGAVRAVIEVRHKLGHFRVDCSQ